MGHEPLQVTVRVVVTIEDDIVVGITLEHGYPGFFSEAEDAMGVWDCSTEEWGVWTAVTPNQQGDEEQERIANLAWKHVTDMSIHSSIIPRLKP